MPAALRAQLHPVLPQAQNIQRFSPPYPLRPDPQAKPDISGVGDPLHRREVSRRLSHLASDGWLAGIACRGSEYAKGLSSRTCAYALLSTLPASLGRGSGLTSMRVGFLCALNEYNARVLLNPREDDFGAVW
jgi:hypothetical protein